jgi:hypothetical protein
VTARTPTLPTNEPGLRAVPPSANSEYMWRRLMNHLYGCGEDALFAWLQSIREAVEEAERKRGDCKKLWLECGGCATGF